MSSTGARARSFARTWLGASVQGPAHRRAGTPKQDAWLGIAGRFGSLVVVADGLGSRPYSRLGALAVCRATHRAVRELAAASEIGDADALFTRLEDHWHDEIAPREPNECSTTVSFSLVHRSGGVLLGQVGDGLVALKADGQIQPLVTERAGFGNETDGLGFDGRHPRWHSRWLPLPAIGFRVLLATDGVSDDLRPEFLGDFIAYVERELWPLTPAGRHRRLCAQLRAWPTPGHSDDKTLALHWSAGEAS